MRLLVSLVLLLTAVPALAQDGYCDSITELNSVYFGYEQITLTEVAVERLEENMSAVLDRCPNVAVQVTGWGDDLEVSPDALSWLRAAAVAEWYIGRGLDAGRFAVRGGGEDPNAFHYEDPNPGDSRARRVESEPMAVADLSTDALDWRDQIAARDDPPPSVIRIADDELTRIHLVMDWALTDGAPSRPACPDLPGRADGARDLVLSSVSLLVGDYDREVNHAPEPGGREIPLDTACHTAAWPASSLLGWTVAEVVPGVYVLGGSLSPAGDPYTAGWIVGPTGNAPTDGLFCTRYQGLETELNAAVQSLAESRRSGDATATRAALDILTQTATDLRDLRDAVTAVGGQAEDARLDCDELHLAYEG